MIEGYEDQSDFARKYDRQGRDEGHDESRAARRALDRVLGGSA